MRGVFYRFACEWSHTGSGWNIFGFVSLYFTPMFSRKKYDNVMVFCIWNTALSVVLILSPAHSVTIHTHQTMLWCHTSSIGMAHRHRWLHRGVGRGGCSPPPPVAAPRGGLSPPNNDPSPPSAPPIFLPTFCQGIMEAPPKYASAPPQPLQRKFPGAATDGTRWPISSWNMTILQYLQQLWTYVKWKLKKIAGRRTSLIH